MPPSLARLRGWPLVAAIAVPLVAVAAVLVVALRGSSAAGDGPAETKPAASLPAAVEGVERRPGARVEAAADRHARLDAAWRAAHLDGRRHAGAARHPTADGVRREHRREALDAATASGTTRVCGASRAPNPAGLGGLVLASDRGCRVAALRRRRDRQAPLAARPGPALVAHRQRRRPLRRRPHGRGAAVLPRLPPPRRAHGATRGGDAGAHRAGEGARRGGAARPQPARRLAWSVRRGLRRRLAPVGLPHAGRPDDDVEGIVSADPLVLDLTVRGHRAYRHIDGRGRLGRYVGKSVRQRAAAAGRARRHRRRCPTTSPARWTGPLATTASTSPPASSGGRPARTGRSSSADAATTCSPRASAARGSPA